MRQNNLTEKMMVCDARLRSITPVAINGRIAAVSGLVVQVAGLAGQVYVGDQLMLSGRDGATVQAEVVGFREGLAQTLPFGGLEGLGPGQPAVVLPRSAG